MRTLLAAASALVGTLVLFLIYVGLQPADFEITRSRAMPAPPAAVYDQLDDFETWLTWSPWQDRDPDQTVEIGGPETGKGAWYTWSGNDDVGQGRMEVLEAVPNEKVVWDLQFIKPFEARNTTAITLAPDGDGTRVTWSMTGTNGFVAKLFGVFIDMDAMVGADFDKGLLALESLSSEAAAVAEMEAAQAADGDAQTGDSDTAG